MGSEKIDNKEPRICPKWLYSLGVNLMYIYMKLFFGLRLDHSGLKDAKGPFLVVANHQSLFDFGIVSKAALPEQLRFMISSHFFHNSIYNKSKF